MMKSILIFLAPAILISAGVHYYYLTIGGTPLEELFNQAVGLQIEEGGINGLPIVVNVVLYVTIIAVLVGVGIFLHFRRKRGENLPNRIRDE